LHGVLGGASDDGAVAYPSRLVLDVLEELVGTASTRGQTRELAELTGGDRPLCVALWTRQGPCDVGVARHRSDAEVKPGATPNGFAASRAGGLNRRAGLARVMTESRCVHLA
jgi:hypothetical protein